MLNIYDIVKQRLQALHKLLQTPHQGAVEYHNAQCTRWIASEQQPQVSTLRLVQVVSAMPVFSASVAQADIPAACMHLLLSDYHSLSSSWTPFSGAIAEQHQILHALITSLHVHILLQSTSSSK